MKIFLDIDGVMVHANPSKSVEFDLDGFYKFNNSAIIALKSICDNQYSNEIILSTSHRFRYSINEWKKIFISRGIRVNKISRIETSIDYNQTRKNEIVNWVDKCHLNSEDILIIDDDKSLNGLPYHLKCRLVLTNPFTGLDIEILEQKCFDNIKIKNH